MIICHRQSDQPVFVLHSWEYVFTNLVMGIFISYPLICRYVGNGVGFLLFEALRSHYCGSPICSTLIVPVPTVGRIACMNPRLWALKMVDPQVTMVVSTLKWSSVGSFGGNAILMNCRLCPRRGSAVLAQACAEGAIGRSNGAKEMGGQRGALKTDLVLERVR